MESDLGQVELVRDINPGELGSSIGSLVEFNGKLYFSADDSTTGSELWVSDGTAEGTQLVADINPGKSGYLFYDGSDPGSFTEFNNRLYFAARDGENGDEIWSTDGTTAGTQLAIDVSPGSDNYGISNSSDPAVFTKFNDRLYFAAEDGNGRELWSTDGTAEGTQLVADLVLGSSNYGVPFSSSPANLTVLGEKLYFSANDGVSGNELWVTDGSTEGTTLAVDIYMGTGNNAFSSYPQSSYIGDLTEFQDKLYFSAVDGSGGGRELWVSDGTEEGTQLLKDIRPDGERGTAFFTYGSNPSNFAEFDDKLYFSANDGVNGNELWVTDGTEEGTQLLKDIYSGADEFGRSYSSYVRDLTEFNGRLYFSADDGVNGRELWATDGTEEGTQLVQDILPGGVDDAGSYYISSSDPADLTVVGDELFFTARTNETSSELFKLTVDDFNSEVNTDFVDTEANSSVSVSKDGNSVSNSSSSSSSSELGTSSSSSSSSAENIADSIALTGGDGDYLSTDNFGKDLPGDFSADIFTFRAGDETDAIANFELGVERFGLGSGLQFGNPTFSALSILQKEEILADLNGVDTNGLSISDFEAI